MRPSSTRKTLLVVVVVLVIAAVLVWLTGRKSDAFVVGGAFALTGDAADWGRDEQRGVQLALSERAATRREALAIDFKVEDAPATDVTAAVSAFRALVDLHKARVVIGPTWDDAAAAIAPIADREGVVVIAPDASSGIEKEGDYGYFFSIFTPEASEMKRLASYMSNQGLTRVAVVYNQDPFSQQWRDAFVEAASANGLSIVEEFPVADPETQDFRTQIERLKGSDVQAVYVEFTTQDTKGPFMRQAQELGLEARIVSSSTTETESLLKNYADYIEGLTYAFPAATGEMESFLGRFEEAYGSKPSSPAAPYAYDAARILLRVVDEGHREPADIKAALLALGAFDGVTATGLRFSSTGRVEWPAESFVIKRVQSGRPEVLK